MKKLQKATIEVAASSYYFRKSGGMYILICVQDLHYQKKNQSNFRDFQKFSKYAMN